MDIEARLLLFLEVCAAVQYAHRNLIVHRDLKPGSIFVTNDGTPKLLDFGIAKLLQAGTDDASVVATAEAVLLMTPRYASPEQVTGKPITTSSDVYSLGVILFELLTGHRPYRFESGTRGEVERKVCEEEPARPSTAIGRVEEWQTADGTIRRITPETAGRNRGGRPDRLRRCLAGDLDNIVLMAMRKEPERRYVSAEQLCEDIRRYLDRRPVIARKDTLAYRECRAKGGEKPGGDRRGSGPDVC